MRNLIGSRKSRFAAVLATGAVSLGLVAGPASAQNNAQQRGLVNVSTGDVTVLENVGIGVAANVCGVSANVLVSQLRDDDSATCETGEQTFTVSR